MLNYIKRKLALLKEIQEIVQKIEKKGGQDTKLNNAFGVITKELINPHTKEELFDSLMVVFETINKNT